MGIQKLKAVRGWVWVRQGEQLILRNPLLAVSLALISAMAMFAMFLVPLLGPFVALTLMPVIIAGYMRVCRALEEDEEVELTHLVAGFQKNLPRLIALGCLLVLGLLVTATVIIAIGGEALRTLFEGLNATTDPKVQMDLMLAAGPEVNLGILVGMSLLVVLGLAFQYAPMLVFFSGMTPFASLRASMIGILRNVIPYTVYAIIMLAISAVLDILPFHTGMIISLPLSFTSLYASYRNIFPFADEIAGETAIPGARA